MSDHLTPERLDEIRERANLQCALDGEDADDLLAEVDRLWGWLGNFHDAHWKNLTDEQNSDMAALIYRGK